ncbi:Uncharacterized conserved protein DUF58 [Elusimicrobium minutum Pei191]|uniref:Uncharacterized conserved protein DUF58 n=1 Tax=Elusimicrobium minutum (strain Pei191) TaxID=445932 RepID=B2KDT1_ELUMP|nr:DUF58 domain-containing protein [Elusimicrobium minutum]ACC98677.1 Uncharacterized conserved protein DUF58 [Elusimicrobium minutum Pei191]
MDTSELLKKVRQIEIRTGRLVADNFAGQYLSVFKGQGIEFAEVREYVAGDDVRSIDWNVSARSGKTYIKQFLEERELTLMIACDVSASGAFGSTQKLKREVAAELAALFAFSALTNNDKVGLMLFSDMVELFIPPKKGKKHILRLVRELLVFEPKNKKTDISLALNTLNKVIKRQGILVLISDFMDEGFEKAFRLSQKKFDLIPVLVRDPLESSVPKLPLYINAVDPESGESAVFNLKDAPKYGDITKREKFFHSLGADYIKTFTTGSAADEVVKFFKKRAEKIKR